MTFRPRAWLLVLLPWALPAWADPGPFLHVGTGLYADHEAYDEPFHPAQDLAGTWLQAFLGAPVGDRTGFEAGVFAEDRTPGDPAAHALPWLRFEYHQGGTRLLMGSLQSAGLHGFLAPLEDPTLAFTRPVEYGLQWLQKDEGFGADVFLDWQQVDQPGQDEIFDYGGVLTADLNGWAALVMQLHGHHEGGRIYNLRVVNNYVPALGLRLQGRLGALGASGLDLFLVGSSDFEGKFDLGPDWGRGLYAAGRVTPFGALSVTGLYWNAQDFFSQEGDPNYNSQGAGLYLPARAYAELGLAKSLGMGGGLGMDASAHYAWGDGFQGWALRLSAQAAFDLALPLEARTPERKETPDAP